MEDAIRRPSALSRPRTIALIVLGIVAVWSFNPLGPLSTALLAVAILLIVGFKQPIWAMAAIIVSQLTATSYMVDAAVGTISLRLLLLLILGGVLWFSKTRIELGPGARRVVIPCVLLIGVSVVANFANTELGVVFKDFKNLGAGLLLVVLLAGVVKNSRDLKLLCGVTFVGITVSAVVGVLQHYQFMGLGQETLLTGFVDSAGGSSRVPGIAETELELSYVLSTAIPVILALYFLGGTRGGMRMLIAASGILMAASLYFTYTRSALLAVLFGVVALLLFRTRIRGEILLGGLLVILVFVSYSGILEGHYLGGRSEDIQDESYIARKILWQAGFAIAVDNPILGIGGDRFREVSPQYASDIDSGLLAWEGENYWGYRTLGSDAVHNDFLKMWVSYGTLALVALLWLCVAILRNLLDCYRASPSSFIKALALGLAAGLVAYLANAFYHNCLQTLPLLWILAGFSIAIAKVALTRRAGSELGQDASLHNPG